MAHSFINPLPPSFTLETLVAEGQWSAVQGSKRKVAKTTTAANKQRPAATNLSKEVKVEDVAF